MNNVVCCSIFHLLLLSVLKALKNFYRSLKESRLGRRIMEISSRATAFSTTQSGKTSHDSAKTSDPETFPLKTINKQQENAAATRVENKL